MTDEVRCGEGVKRVVPESSIGGTASFGTGLINELEGTTSKEASSGSSVLANPKKKKKERKRKKKQCFLLVNLQIETLVLQ